MQDKHWVFHITEQEVILYRLRTPSQRSDFQITFWDSLHGHLIQITSLPQVTNHKGSQDQSATVDRSWLTGLSAAAVVVVVVVVVVVRVGGRPGGFSSNAPNYAQTIRALLVLSLLLSKLVFLHLIQTLLVYYTSPQWRQVGFVRCSLCSRILCIVFSVYD